jgi:hypothetical protein
MDFQQFLDAFKPKDYTGQLDPDERVEFSKRYGNKADEQIAFLAANKALPFQNDVESFENPDFFTGLRRGAGFYTDKEKSLMKKQQRLVEGELKPIQEARQKLGLQLAAHMMSMDQWKQQQDYNTPTLGEARALGYTPEMLPAVPGQMEQAPLVGPMPGQMREGITGPPTAQTAGVNLWPSVGAMQRDFREKAPAFFEEQPRPFQSMEKDSAKLTPGQRMEMDQLHRMQLQQGKALPPEQIYGRTLLIDAEKAKLEAADFQEAHPNEPLPAPIAARLDILQPGPEPVEGESVPMGATRSPSPLRLIKGMTGTEYGQLRKIALEEYKEQKKAETERQEIKESYNPETGQLEYKLISKKTGKTTPIEGAQPAPDYTKQHDRGKIAEAQAEFAALPAELQTSQNAALIAGRHKGVLTEDIMKGIKNPNQPLVNINTGVSASEEAAKQFMASTRASYDQLKTAPVALRNIEEAKRLIPAAKGFMGPGGETLLEAAKFLNNRLGTKIDTTGVKNAEELRTRIFFNILDNLKKMDAQPSQYQQQIMMESLGKLGTDPNALGEVLDAFSDSIRSKVEAHNAEVESASGRNVKFPYNPIIKVPPRAEKKAEAAPSGGPARIQSDADYNKLPSGAMFIAPDGTTRRKP